MMESPELTMSRIETLLKRHDQNQLVDRVISVTVADLTPLGENLKSHVQRITVVTARLSGKLTTRGLICKDLPLVASSRLIAVQAGHFTREITLYRDILTVYEDLLDEHEYTEEALWPRCIDIDPYSRIVVEDLKPLGYQMADKSRGLDLDHCIQVVQGLGMYHALSLKAKELHLLPQDVFKGTYTSYQEFNLDIFHAELTRLGTKIKPWGNQWNWAAVKIQSLITELRNRFEEMFKINEGGLNVLNHGDIWTNNILFKYSSYSGKPEKVRFIDFQASHYNTPALDLVFFFARNPDLNVRREHTDQLIQLYQRSLTLNMDRLGVSAAQRRPSVVDIRNEIDRLGLFKLYLVLVMLSKEFTGDEDLFDIDNYLKNEDNRRTGDACYWLNLNNEYYAEILKIALRDGL